MRVVGRAMCLAWAPAMLGKIDPFGPAGRPLPPRWQERQVPAPVATVTGLAAVWQAPQRGASAWGEVPVWAWQVPQSAVKVAWVAVMWPLFWVSLSAARKGTG